MHSVPSSSSAAAAAAAAVVAGGMIPGGDSFMPSRSLEVDERQIGRRKLESPTESYDSNHSNINVPGRSLMDMTRMKKVINELIETERTYVGNLSHMIKLYLEPLQEESFMLESEITSLFGNIQEIYAFQREFLHALEEAVESGDVATAAAAAAAAANNHPVVTSLDSPKQLKVSFFLFFSFFLYFFLYCLDLHIQPSPQNVLLSIASTFLYYTDHFKLYSSFCASHSKAQKALHPSRSSFPIVSGRFRHYHSSLCCSGRKPGIAGLFDVLQHQAAAVHVSGIVSDQTHSAHP